MTNNDLSTRSWKVLSAQDKRDRLLVIKVLNRLRKGENLTYVLKNIGVSKELVHRHASSYLTEDDLNG